MFTTSGHSAVVSVINDLVTDQRVHRTCMVLHEQGYAVLLVGRRQRKSMPLGERPYRCHRMKLLFESGPAFYLEFQLRLLWFLLRHKADLYWANDLDTLWPNYQVARWRKKKLIYDSHEIFCEVPELQHTPFKKKLWERLEGHIVPKLRYCLTVNQSIATWFGAKYKVPFGVLRNIPDLPATITYKSRQELGLPSDRKILLLQGAGINIQRGAEELVEAMASVEGALLLIIGGGDVIEALKARTQELHLGERIRFIGKMPPAELRHYTANADFGLSIDKDTNLNYHFSLPNKIFDYLHAGVPVIASRLPEISRLIEHYEVGTFIRSHQPTEMAEDIRAALQSPDYPRWKANTAKAARENNWALEKKVIEDLIREE